MTVIRFRKIKENHEVIKFNLELKCNNFNKKVSREMKSSKDYFELINSIKICFFKFF